jgi:hypothetical protein
MATRRSSCGGPKVIRFYLPRASALPDSGRWGAFLVCRAGSRSHYSQPAGVIRIGTFASGRPAQRLLW